ncbi:MAG: hypothetical protein A2521_09360 [Deltaproteobacteria bacterium RIFOXYD12_FULL_57_12]|nr:MAG: hypothetical protein A2521_09360 [Deltaproteobacteria bacterium RIFOXYD12_FULL_57_12]
MAGIQASTNPKQDDVLRQRLHDRLDGLARRRNLLPAGGEIKEVTVLISDLRGFTTISDAYAAADVVLLLNRYFTRMTEIISRYGGKVDKFIGDSIMALFVAPMENPKDTERAVCCAAEMQIAMDSINKENIELGMPAIYMGIGLNTGRVVAGKIGSDLHSEYTVIGAEVNLASRIESSTLRGQILLSENTYTQTAHITQVKEPFSLAVKGKQEAIRLYELVAVGPPYDLVVPEREARRTPRASVDIPFEFQFCDGKIVISDFFQGRIMDLSSGGLFASTTSKIDPHCHIRFRLKTDELGVISHDIYGKVLKVDRDQGLYLMNVEFTIIDPQDSVTLRSLVKRLLGITPP